MRLTAAPLLYAAVLLGVGGALGYSLAIWRAAHSPAVATIPRADAPVAALSATPDRPQQALAIVVAASGKRASTMVLGPRGVVILPIRFVASAASLGLRVNNGRITPLTTVVAVDARSGLVALDAGPQAAPARPVPSTQGSLFVGRDVTARLADGQWHGQVAAPATRNALGGYEYVVTLPERAGRAGAGPLLADGELAGYLLPATADGAAIAVDVATIADLIGSNAAFSPLRLDAFANYYRTQTPTGRLENAQDAVASGRWREALDSSHELLRMDPVFADQAARLLSEATDIGVQATIDAGLPTTALQLLNDADTLLGHSDKRQSMRGRILEAVGDPAAAARAYLGAGQRGREPLRRLLWLAADDGLLDDPELLALVTQALASDSQHAAYHHLAGLIHLRAGRDAAAVAALSSAASLSTRLAAELEPLLERARGRLDNPARVDVPVFVEGNVMIVQASLNGSDTHRMLLDTGATYTAISLETALRLGIRDLFFGAPVVGLQTANGRIYTNVINLSSIALGNARANNVDVVILETMRGVDGLLGQSFLNRFDVDIRRGAGVVSLTPR